MKIGRSRTLKSAKYLQKRRKKTILITSLSIFIVLISIFIVILILHFSFFNIKNIEIRGIETLTNEEIIPMINESLLGNYLYSIPRTSLFFYPKHEIQSTILDKFKKINTLEIHLVSWNTLRLDIAEREAKAMVCDGFDDNSNCFLVDKTAYIFDKSSDSTYFKYYMTSNATSTAIGSNFLTQEKFDGLQKLVHDIEMVGISINGLLVGDDGSYELYIENSDKSTAVVYFDDRNSFDKTTNNLITFWQNSLNKKIGLQTIPNFDYINLRFGNNIYYLIKNESEKIQNKI
jgi:hypothetical protein